MAALRGRFFTVVNTFSFFTEKKSLNFKKYVLIVRTTIGRTFSVKTIKDIEERKVNVNGFDINYVRVGIGNHPVLLLPGALGTAWTDFKPQLENLDKNKLTVVAWDPPGYGKSRPPNKTYSDDFLQRDADYAFDLMKVLGYKKFSLIGWSDGGITSLILAAKNPDSIRKMIVFGANAYILPEELQIYKSIKNIDTWSDKMKQPLIEVYGEEYFRNTWSDWVDGMERIYEKNKGDLCKNVLAKIKCPTLIIHGAKDVIVKPEHPVYLKDHIKNSEVIILEKGAHNLHLRYHEEFNTLAMKFLTED
ncbi:valacyclovir hydrolase-like [Vespa mandarinia]|uniref:valacyclovir hydrolase-like n=1 Tax=Vespa mandarinia TaxID=7446 RepID=UPI00160DB7F9|nr:valacyclovir hydrolase-like [Vespa mandarinia]